MLALLAKSWRMAPPKSLGDGCRSRIAKPKNPQHVDFQLFFGFGLRCLKAEISDFVTTGRGFCHDSGAGGGKKGMLQARGIMLVPNHNIIPMSSSQLSTGLSLSVLSPETAEALQTFAAFLGKGGEAAFQSFAAFRRGRTRGPRGVRRFRGRAAQAGAWLRGEACRRPGRERRPGLPGRPSLLPVHQSDNPHCSVRSSSCVRCTARREARRSRRLTKAWACKYLTGPAARSDAPVPLHAGGRGRNPWAAHEPVVELRVC